MSQCKRKYEQSVLTVVRQHLPSGWTAEFVKRRGAQAKHLRIVVSGPDVSRFMTLPGSPQNERDQLNYARQWVRRTLAELSS